MRWVWGFLNILKSSKNAKYRLTWDHLLFPVNAGKPMRTCRRSGRTEHHQPGFIVALLSFVCLEYLIFSPFSGR